MYFNNLPNTHRATHNYRVSFIMCKLMVGAWPKFGGQWWGEEVVVGGAGSDAELEQMYVVGS